MQPLHITETIIVFETLKLVTSILTFFTVFTSLCTCVCVYPLYYKLF